MERQDLNGYRKPQDVVQAFDLSKIELNSEDIEKIKQDIICDDHLSTTSKAPVQNKVVTNALNNKVTKETGKGLSEENYTTTEKTKLSGIDSNAEENTIETIKVNGVTQTITNKTVDLTITNTGYTSVNKTASDSTNKLTLPVNTKELFIYFITVMSGKKYVINLGHFLTDNFNYENYVFNETHYFKNTGYKIQYICNISYAANSFEIYFTSVGDESNNYLNDTTLYVDYR